MLVGVSDCWIGTAFSYVADTTKSNVRTRYFAFLTAAIASGFIIGPATSGFFSRSSPATPLYVLIAVLVFAAIWGYFSMPESLLPAQRSTVLPLSHLNPLTQTRDILQFPQLRLLLLSYSGYRLSKPHQLSVSVSLTPANKMLALWLTHLETAVSVVLDDCDFAFV